MDLHFHMLIKYSALCNSSIAHETYVIDHCRMAQVNVYNHQHYLSACMVAEHLPDPRCIGIVPQRFSDAGH